MLIDVQTHIPSPDVKQHIAAALEEMVGNIRELDANGQDIYIMKTPMQQMSTVLEGGSVQEVSLHFRTSVNTVKAEVADRSRRLAEGTAGVIVNVGLPNMAARA